MHPLAPPPTDSRELELWLQHAAGYLLLDATRSYAQERLPAHLNEEARAAALQAIDDTVYGLMQLLDGVTTPLANATHGVALRTTVELRDSSDDTVQHALDLQLGDGMCMGWHGWVDGDFGHPPVTAAQ